MQSDGKNQKNGIKAEDVISKLKDDGDFDTLRLKIIRKLKENEDLRSSIISAVKQSAALNRPGAEKLKRRQLSDAVHEEIGNKVMGQISDGIWEVIRSSDGMKNEIRETVQSVYYKIVNPRGNGVDEAAAASDDMANRSLFFTNKKGTCDDEPVPSPVSPPCQHSQANVIQGEHKDPSDLSQSDRCQSNDGKEKRRESPARKNSPNAPVKNLPSESSVAPVANVKPPGISTNVIGNKRGLDIDEDPDVPPGFG